MDPVLYSLLAARARGHCECGCSFPVPPGEVDHFFSRGRAEEVEFTCWVLTPRCHYAKTQNVPDAATWLRKFIAHCERYAPGGAGYREAIVRASARLQFVETRTKLTEGLPR